MKEKKLHSRSGRESAWDHALERAMLDLVSEACGIARRRAGQAFAVHRGAWVFPRANQERAA